MQQVAQDVKPWLPVGSSKGKDYLDPSWSFFWQRHFLDQDVHQAKDYNRGVEVVSPHEALLLSGVCPKHCERSPLNPKLEPLQKNGLHTFIHVGM